MIEGNSGRILTALDSVAASTVDADIAGQDDGSSRRFMPASVDQTVIDISDVHITMPNITNGEGALGFMTTTMESDV